MAEWDEKNRPRYYIPGVSPGFSQYMQGEEKLSYQGFARKLMKAARFGFEFAMVDYEAMSEMFEPDIERKIDVVRKAEGLEFGLHLPIDLDPSISFASEWQAMHDIFIRGAYAGRILKARFIHTHSTNAMEPALTFNMGGMERPGKLVAFDGTNLGQMLKEVDSGTFSDNWFEYFGIEQKKPGISMAGWLKAKYFKLMFQGIVVTPEPIVALYEFETYDDAIREYLKILEYSIEKAKSKIRESLENEIRDLEEEKSENLKQLDETKKKMESLISEYNELSKKAEGLEGEEKESVRSRMSEIEKEIAGMEKRMQEIQKRISHYSESGEEELMGLDQRISIRKRKLEKLEEIEISKDGEEGLKQYIKIITSGEIMSLFPELKGEIDSNIEDYVRQRRDVFAYNPQNYPIFVYELSRHVSTYNVDAWFDQWVNNGSEATESVAYRAIAKYMYETRDPLWIEMVEKPYNESGEFSGEIDPDVVIDFENKIEPMKKIWSNRYGKARLVEWLGKTDRRRLLKRIVAAVAAKYIQGHLFVKKNGRKMGAMKYLIGKTGIAGDEADMSIYEYCKRHRIRIYFENGFSREQQFHPEGKLRMMHMEDHCRMVKVIDDGEWVGYCPDFEHIVVNLIDPMKDIEKIPDGYAKYISEIHINAPRPINATHAPIELLSTDAEEIYRWLYGLWKKGMKAAYMIWEMGSYGVRQTALAFRKFKEELDKPLKGLGEPTPPDKLPPEFFGIDEKLEAFTKMAVMENAFAPLEGLLLIPEEKHTFLGKAAKDRQKLGEWATEELW